MMILRTVSGIASRCGSNALLRVVGALVALSATVWLGAQLWGWAIANADNPGPMLGAAFTSLGYMIASIVAIAVKSDPPDRWTLETMTRYAPFFMWRAMISDGRVTGWKLLLWPLLVPAEGLACLWLAIGWLVRLLDIDLSKR